MATDMYIYIYGGGQLTHILRSLAEKIGLEGRRGSRAEPSRAEPSRALPNPSRAELRLVWTRPVSNFFAHVTFFGTEPSRAQPIRYEPKNKKASRDKPRQSRSKRYILQNHQFLQRIICFYTRFTNIGFYNDFDYFAIETCLPST